ncbi:MAG: hypothetical protein EPN33_00235 [Acidobacteria bacterium]|nr:MAG: hypothetical protein EPN33_00235 [Acidobacteriota bacterium]
MKMGTEKKSEVIALVVLLAVAGGLLGRSLLGGGGPATPAASPLAAVAPAASGGATPLGWTHVDPRLDLTKLTDLRARTYTGDGRNLFHFGAAPPPAPVTPSARIAANARAEAARAESQRRALEGPPPPPPLPLKFFGFAQAEGQPERIFLQFGEDSYVVSQGDVIAHRYKVLSIGKVAVRIQDLTNLSTQEVPLQRPAPGQ